MRSILVFLLVSALVQPVSAEISLDELNSAVSERVKSLASFEDALADSDPRRALAAMQIMIEQGDADQRRMAIRSGLYSTDVAVRSTVLRAIFDSAPNLIVDVKPISDKVNQYFARNVAGFSGTLRTDMSASMVRKLGAWDSEQQCWLDSIGKRCIATLNSDVVSFFLDTWAQLALDKEGNLVGPATFSQTPVELTIQLAE